jgi:1,4-alpha-glucan branching enzyme
MAVTQDHIHSSTPMGANLVGAPLAGATFRVWAPLADAVYVNGTFGGVQAWNRDADPAFALQRIAGSDWWGGFVAGAHESDLYKFFVVGLGTTGFKRDPYARERQANGNCVIRAPADYPWHDDAFAPPAFNDIVIYQLHVGTFYRPGGVRDGTFLDVVIKIPYLADLGINVVQLLPVNEFETDNSEGYNGSDYFTPEFRYAAADPTAPIDRLATANNLLKARGQKPVTASQVSGPYGQLKLLVDLCHVYGMAVHFDVVYNHAGDFNGDDESTFFWDREQPGDNDRSQYFINAQNMGPGGLPFALWKTEVRGFLIDHARYLIDEFHVDGLRYDEVSLLCDKNSVHGWTFCQDITSTIRFIKPNAFHNAEFWPVNTMTVVGAQSGGAGFDGTQNDGLRLAIRGVLGQAVSGRNAIIDLDAVADQLSVPGFPAKWRAVQCIENHDRVFQGNDLRISRAADPGYPRSWYGCSRSRVALGLLMTAPGIPQIFMGEEFLEDKQWSDNPDSSLHIYWDGLSLGEKPMVDFLRFTRELIGLRRAEPALRSETINVFHWHNQNRVIAFHRWLDGIGRDIVVAATLSEINLYGYRLGFPGGGRWVERFNSDVYEHWVNPWVAGNGGGVFATDDGLHGFSHSAALTLPANSILIFSR